VVAQHGAALANLVWCSPQTRVLEIVPRQPIGVDLDYFKRLSNSFGLRYLRVEQNGLHAAVAPHAVVPAARALLEAEPARSG
jgi:capsular polysaccharide biosynthesis protein